jgi:ADP-sugar diphosphatase
MPGNTNPYIQTTQMIPMYNYPTNSDVFRFPVCFKPGNVYGKTASLTADQALTFTQKNAAFQRWLQRIDFTLNSRTDTVHSVEVLEIYPFGPVENGKGFVMANAKVTRQLKDGKTIELPGAAFLRGDAVAILPILIDEADYTKRYVLTTVQPRVPTGEATCEEIPAGMMDDSQSFVGTAAKELKEETGIEIKESELQELGSVSLSPGGCDEVIELFYVEKRMSADAIAALQGKCTGVIQEGESIKLRIRTQKDFAMAIYLGEEISDAKALVAYFRYTGGGIDFGPSS